MRKLIEATSRFKNGAIAILNVTSIIVFTELYFLKIN